MGPDKFVAEFGYGGGELLLHRLLEWPGVFVRGRSEIAVGDEENGFGGVLFHEAR